MAKSKKKNEKTNGPGPMGTQGADGNNALAEPAGPVAQAPSPERAAEEVTSAGIRPVPSPADAVKAGAETGAPQPAGASLNGFSQSLLRRWMPDLIKVALALAVIGFAAAIWYKPPLIRASFPYVSYQFKGQRANDVVLYRPLAMPTRYYIALPRKLAGRYEWFAVDRRREVVALTEAPPYRALGRPAIKRSDPLGLDLEFRKLDGSEWQIHFFEDSIVFSNALLTVRMDTKETGAR